ncbi:hypothetical protein GOV10_01240 [Candidatus Woesearchaeota archaeon]|nr:hypothetical protein [Candidatus Woesearchaeota archaeon]
MDIWSARCFSNYSDGSNNVEGKKMNSQWNTPFERPQLEGTLEVAGYERTDDLDNWHVFVKDGDLLYLGENGEAVRGPKGIPHRGKAVREYETLTEKIEENSGYGITAMFGGMGTALGLFYEFMQQDLNPNLLITAFAGMTIGSGIGFLVDTFSTKRERKKFEAKSNEHLDDMVKQGYRFGEYALRE